MLRTLSPTAETIFSNEADALESGSGDMSFDSPMDYITVQEGSRSALLSFGAS